MIEPSDTRECDGYPGLREATFEEAEAEALEDERASFTLLFGCCGDPGDCGTCGGA